MRGRAVRKVITDELAATREPGVTAEVVMRPISPEWPEARLAARIDFYRSQGVPWQAIADELGLPDKRAVKRRRRELEHMVRVRQLAG